MSPNDGILLNSVLRLKLLIIYFAACSLISLEFLLPHVTHFDNNIGLLLLVFETLELMFSALFYTLNN